MDPKEGQAKILTPASSSSNQNPNLDSAISSLPDLPSPPISSSVDKALAKPPSSSGDDDSSPHHLQRVSLLHKSTKPWCTFRKRATLHNSISWFLPSDVTITVFSMLDTKTLMQAAACCTMFNEYAMNPLCYSHMDLTTAFENVDDGVLSTMIHRAGKELSSLKLGCVCDQDRVIPFLTSSCLAPLSSKRHQLDGNLLRSLHLYNLEWMDHNYLCDALSACSNLIDLKIVGMTGSVERELDVLMTKCRLIEHLFLQYCFGDGITDSTIRAFVTNCPHLSSLTLIGFPLNDAIARSLVQGFPKLKYMKLSSSGLLINGSFLRDLGSSCKDSPLETLILRNCRYLMENEVLQFLKSLIAGDFRFIRYIDVSNYKGLACDENGHSRTSVPSFPLKKLKKERSDVKFVADFPSGLPRYFNYQNCR